MRRILVGLLAAAGIVAAAGAAIAADLDDIKARGVLRHLAIPYANFNTGSGDGMEVELTRRFAQSIGVRYEYVQSDWGTIVPDLIGRKIKVTGTEVELKEEVPARGDMIANGFTVLPWRQKVVNYSVPTFPNQIWLIARADSPVRPIKPSGDIAKDIEKTKVLMKGRSVMSMEKTCLDPALYNLAATGAQVICYKGSLNELAPAVLKKDAEMTILDVPDALVALDKWKGKLKIIGPVSDRQIMAAGFPKESPKLLEAYNDFIRKAQHDGTYLAVLRKYYPTATRYFTDFFKGMK